MKLGTQTVSISNNANKYNYGGDTKTALYCRLSRDDGDSGDSNSIIHQKEMLLKYAKENGLRNTEFYVDDGYSGTNFNRPDFQRMMTDIDDGKVKTVIVKDMSRFGRDYIMVGYYTEILFINSDIRFIAITDGVDSISMVDNDLTPFKNIMNEWYAKDTSKKIRAVFRTKGNSGKHLTNNPPYGYMKSPDDKTKWIIDEEAAETVRQIFRLYLDGKGITEIAKILTEQKVDTPQIYAEKHGNKVRRTSEYPEIWSMPTVRGMLSQYAYAGCTVNFTTTKKSYKCKKQVRLPKESWVIYENTQEAIIDRKSFDTVQRMRENKRAYTKYNEVNMFSGLLYCADCGNNLTIQRIAKYRDMDHFTCATYRKKKKGMCSAHKILVSRLKTLVLHDINRVIEYVFLHDKEFVETYKNKSAKETIKLQASIKAEQIRITQRLGEIDRIIRKLYEDNVNGRISDDRFDSLAKSYETEQSELKVKLQDNSKILADMTAENIQLEKFVNLVNRYTNISELTPEILHSFIDKIFIGETEVYNGQKMQDVRIIYNLVGAINLPQNNM